MNDFLGQELVNGDYVAGIYPDNETPAIFQVRGFTPKKCKLAPIRISSDIKYTTVLKFGKDLLKIDSEAVEQLIVQKPLDSLLQELEIGDFVYGSGGEYIDPIIFEIVAFAPTVAILKKVYGPAYIRNNFRRTADLIKIDAGIVTMHLLTKEHTA